MSRKKTELNPIRAERLKILIDREKERDKTFTQTKFAKQIYQTQQNVSKILNLHVALTEENARKIIECFPEYRIEWLLGYDDIMTVWEKVEHDENLDDLFTDSMWGVLEKSLNKEGKSLKFVHKAGQHVDSRQRFYMENDCYYSVVDFQGKELKRLDPFEMLQIEEMIQEYADFITGKYL